MKRFTFGLFALLLCLAGSVGASTTYDAATRWGDYWPAEKFRHYFGGPVKFNSEVRSSFEAGAANGTGVACIEYGDGVIHKTRCTFTAASITMTDAGANGNEGALKFYDLPAGPITILGTTMNITTLAGSGGIADTAAVVCSVGTVVAAADDTLTSTEANLVASATGTLTAGAGACALHGSLVATAFDGHTTPTDIYVNFAMPDAGTSGNDTLAVTGTITVNWISSGDY